MVTVAQHDQVVVLAHRVKRCATARTGERMVYLVHTHPAPSPDIRLDLNHRFAVTMTAGDGLISGVHTSHHFMGACQPTPWQKTHSIPSITQARRNLPGWLGQSGQKERLIPL